MYIFKFRSVEKHPHDEDAVIITIANGERICISKREAKRLSFLLEAAVKDIRSVEL